MVDNYGNNSANNLILSSSQNSTVLSEPKFGPRNKEFLDPPLSHQKQSIICYNRLIFACSNFIQRSKLCIVILLYKGGGVPVLKTIFFGSLRLGLKIRPLDPPLHVNPFSPKSDQRQFSPNNISTSSREKVLRIHKMITNGKIPWSFIKFSQLILIMEM